MKRVWFPITLGVTFLAFAASAPATEIVLEGDHRIAADSPEPGSLVVEGALSVGGTFDFGSTTISSVVYEAVVQSYSEAGAIYTVDTIAAQDGVIFRWRENGAGTPKTKMVLGADNELSLQAPNYNPAHPDEGLIALTPATSGSNITIDGATVITSDTYAATGGILSLNTGDSRYVSSSDLIVGSATTSGTTGPTFAFPGGAAGAYSVAGLDATASGLRSVATGYHSTATGSYSLAIGTQSIASGLYSSAFAMNSEATGQGATALGYATNATGYESVAVGYGSTASGSHSLSLGSQSHAYASQSVTLGTGTWAEGTSSVAVGPYSETYANSSVAIGAWSWATGVGSLTLGYNAEAQGNYSISAGAYTTSAGYGQFVIGRYNILQGDPESWVSTDQLFIVGNGSASSARSNALTIGKDAIINVYAPSYNPANANVGKITITPSLTGSTMTIDGATVITNATYAASGGLLSLDTADSRYVSSSSLAVGSTTTSGFTGPTFTLPGGTASGAYSVAGLAATASAYKSLALAYGSSASGSHAIAIGTSSIASGQWSSAFATNAQATNTSAVALGYSSIASGVNSTAVGYGSRAFGNFSVALGANSYAYTYSAVSVGHNSAASGNGSVALGEGSEASGGGSVTVGASSWAAGENAVTLGNASVATGANAITMGYETQAEGDHSVAAGQATVAAGSGQFVIGRYNILQGNPTSWVATDQLFVVGNGSSDSSRANAFVVKKNGDTTVNGKTALNGDTTITGNVVVSGRIRVQPQGDLSMGDFTSEPAP